jgi:peptide methionine sulfoxide reductase msrA/msrB
MFRYHSLDAQSKKVIEEKGTEAPFSGSYESFHEAGVYVCKKCDYPLYLSQDKFDAGCGWPSFDDEIQGHVLKQKDKDGQRTEILCARCHGHLGHVFYNENFTQKNTRHCVNSLSLNFIPAFTKDGLERAVLASGCFWGTEYFLKQLKGVKHVTSGFIGGHVVNPSYEEVCSSITGHKEACEVLFDPDVLNYQKLIEYFFETHDFTQKNGQGPDIGPQYLSAVFVYSKKQEDIANRVISILKQKGFSVATTVEAGSVFYKAEDYHQDYYAKHQKTPYCHKHRAIF